MYTDDPANAETSLKSDRNVTDAVETLSQIRRNFGRDERREKKEHRSEEYSLIETVLSLDERRQHCKTKAIETKRDTSPSKYRISYRFVEQNRSRTFF